MAFTTKAGNPTSITGTDNVDVLTSVDLAGNFIVRAEDAADIVTLTSTVEPSQLTDVSVYGGNGADTISSLTAQLFRGRTQGGEGTDTINYGTVNTYRTYGGQDNDTIDFVTALNSTVQGSLGNDTIGGTTAGTATNSQIYGGAGNDNITTNAIASSTVQGSNGNDTINLQAAVTASSKVNGGADNDSINVNGAVTANSGSTINGNKGADSIFTEQGANLAEVTLFGGSGQDIIRVISSQVTISGDLGADNLTGGVGDDVSVSGGEGIDTISINTGLNLAAVAAAGNGGGAIGGQALIAADAIAANAQATSSVNGGAGNDVVNRVTSTGSVTVMQGRTASTAATAAAQGDASAIVGTDAVADLDVITFGNGVDVVTNFQGGAAGAVTAAQDLVGAELTTTRNNLSFRGFDGAAAASFVDGAAAAFTWADVLAAGKTTVISGALAAGNIFTVNNTNATLGRDFMIIQGDGSGILANSSITIIDTGAIGAAGASALSALNFGGGTAATANYGSAFTNFIG